MTTDQLSGQLFATLAMFPIRIKTQWGIGHIRLLHPKPLNRIWSGLTWGRYGVEKNKVQEHWNWQILSLSLTDISQDQGSGYSLRVSSASLYGVSPSKCWGWSNLGHSLSLRLWTIPHSWKILFLESQLQLTLKPIKFKFFLVIQFIVA